MSAAKQIWRYGAATAEVTHEQGLCVLDLRGPVTRRVLDQIKVDLFRTMPRTFVIIIVLSEAAMVLTEEELADFDLDAHLHGVLTLPAVFVANAEQAASLHGHCASMVHHGLTRVTTTSWPVALQWAARKIAFAELKTDLQR
jgi:hypothetical protein